MSRKITTFFGKSATTGNPSESVPEQKKTDRKNVRTLKSQTLLKWINDDLATANADVWLKHEDDGKGCVSLMKCSICTKFQNQIQHNRDFSDAWIKGTSNLRLSNASDHSATKCHQHAYRLYVNDLKSSGKRADNLHNPFQPAADQRTLPDSFTKLSKVQEEQAIKKFEIAYFVAKKALPFTVYEDLIELEKHHGVDVGDVYATRQQCGMFIDVNGDYIASQLQADLAKVKFYSVLSDGSTDNSITEKEVIYVLYFDPYSKDDEVEVKLTFLYLKDVPKADAQGIKTAIEDSFHSLGILPSELYSKLVGFGADGASVNSGNKNGVKALLEERAPWLVYTWCIAHKLELALKDALDGTAFEKVDEMLNKLYSIYNKSPKKLHELKVLHDVLKQSFDFEEGSLKPKRSSGTRWISFKLSALRLVLDKYGVYMQHLENLIADDSTNSKDREKIRGYLRRWKSSQMLLNIALFIDVLNPAAILSKAFQEDGIDSVGAVHNLKRSEQELNKLISRSFEDLPSIKYLLKKIKKTNSSYIYQEIEFTAESFENAIDTVKSAKNSFIKSVHSAINARLEGASSIHLDAIANVLNTELWKSVTDVEDIVFVDDMIIELVEKFHPVMLKEGLSLDTTPHDILEEWHDMLTYTMNFLKPQNTSYKKTWKLLFNCSYSYKWKNILLLIELLFSVPVCNAKLERLFSHLRRVKNDFRCSLGEHRLTNILRIIEEGPPLGSFDASAVVHLWQSQKVRRPNQKRRAQYKPRKKRVKYYHKAIESEAEPEGDISDMSKSHKVAVVGLDSDSDEISEEDVITASDNDLMHHTVHTMSGSGSDTDDVNTFHRLFDSDDNASDSFEGFLPEDIF
jgi:hypothetical protein